MQTRLLGIFLMIVIALSACARQEGKPDSPVATFKAYVNAVKRKDTTEMKLLLSEESIKMHETEAAAQNVPLDDIVTRDPLVNETQKTFKFRNETIDGDRATLEIEDAFGTWSTLPFVRENGEWKIDKKGYADRLQQEIELDNQQMDDYINQGKGPPQL